MSSFASVLLVAIFLSLSGVFHGPTHQGADHWAARAGLFVLRASLSVLPGQSEAPQYMLNSQTTRMNESEFVDALVRLAKPLSCTAQLLGDAVSLKCEILKDSTGGDWLSTTSGKIVNSLVALSRAGSPKGLADPIVELRSGRDTLLAPLSGVERFYHDYFLPHSVTLEPPDARAASAGASAVLIVGSASMATRIELSQ